MKYKRYIHMLTLTDRKRYQHFKKGNKIISFVVQYETKIGDTWYPVVRYDTSNKVVHKDILDIKGLREKIFLGITDYKETLNLADTDIEKIGRYIKRDF